MGGKLFREKLDRHTAAKLRVFRQMHFTYPPSADLRAAFITAKLCAPVHTHLKSLIKTTSLSMTPREQTSFPSRDQSKEKIRSVLKLVNCLGGLPSIG